MHRNSVHFALFALAITWGCLSTRALPVPMNELKQPLGDDPLVFLRVESCWKGAAYSFAPRDAKGKVSGGSVIANSPGFVGFSCGAKSDLRYPVVLSEGNPLFQPPGALIVFRPAPGNYGLLFGSTHFGDYTFTAEKGKIRYWGELIHPGELPPKGAKMPKVVIKMKSRKHKENLNALGRTLGGKISSTEGLLMAWYMWPGGYGSVGGRCKPIASVPKPASVDELESPLDFIRYAATKCDQDSVPIQSKAFFTFVGEGADKKEVEHKYLYIACGKEFHVAARNENDCRFALNDVKQEKK